MPVTRPFEPLGSTGLRQWGGYVDEEWHKALRGVRGARLFREMADNEPIVGGVLALIDGLVRQAEFKLEAADESPEAMACAEFVRGCMDDLESTWEDFLSEVLSMLPFGWAYFETVYKRRLGDRSEGGSKFSDGMIGWRGFEIRAQDSLLRWEFDPETERLLGMWQSAPPKYNQVFIPIDKALLFRTRAHKGNPEGRSFLRNAYRSWFIKKRLEEVEGFGIERDLAGYPVLEVPPELLASTASDEQKALLAELEKKVSQVRRDEREGLVIPAEAYTDVATGTEIKTGYKFRLMTAGGSRQLAIGDAIERHEHRISVSVLADFVLLGSGPTGSWALSSDKTDMFSIAVGAFLDSICGVLNRQAVPPLCRLNAFPQEVWPKFVHGDVEAPSLAEVAAYIRDLVGAGAITPDEDLERDLRAKANLPMPAAPIDPLAGAPGAPPPPPPGSGAADGGEPDDDLALPNGAAAA